MKYDNLIIDIDGVIHHNKIPIEGINETFEKMEKYNVVLLTNDDRYEKKEIKKKLLKYGIKIPKSFDIYTSGYSMYDNLKKEKIKNILTFGSVHLKRILQKIPTNYKGETFIVIGILNRKLKDREFKKIIQELKNGAKLFLTAIDPFIPPNTHEIKLMPLQLLKKIEIELGEKVFYKTFGKPNINIDKFFKTNNTLIIGDTIETDIQQAKNLNLKSLLVLSGSTKKENLNDLKIQPDYIIEKLSDIFQEKILS